MYKVLKLRVQRIPRGVMQVDGVKRTSWLKSFLSVRGDVEKRLDSISSPIVSDQRREMYPVDNSFDQYLACNVRVVHGFPESAAIRPQHS